MIQWKESGIWEWEKLGPFKTEKPEHNKGEQESKTLKTYTYEYYEFYDFFQIVPSSKLKNYVTKDHTRSL